MWGSPAGGGVGKVGEVVFVGVIFPRCWGIRTFSPEGSGFGKGHLSEMKNNNERKMGVLEGIRRKSSKLGTALASSAVILPVALMAQEEGSGNAGADTVINAVSGLALVASAVVAAAVLVVIVPWGAKIAVRVFKSLAG